MRQRPLLVHLLFHPGSFGGRELARFLQHELNDDALVPELQIPTFFCPVTETNEPPAAVRLNQAKYNFIVPLADDEMAVDEKWSSFVADVWLASQTSPNRCVPFQLSSNAWPLDERLRNVNFGRAHLQRDYCREISGSADAS